MRTWFAGSVWIWLQAEHAGAWQGRGCCVCVHQVSRIAAQTLAHLASKVADVPCAWPAYVHAGTHTAGTQGNSQGSCG